MKHVGRAIAVLIAIMMALMPLTACTANEPPTENGGSPATRTESEDNAPNAGTDDEKETKMLIAYFSCTGTTEGVAKNIADATGGTLYRILPETPYTAADLDYNDEGSRANKEQNNANARPAIKGGAANIAKYDVIFLGYPIWWGQAPKIIYTFLEKYDFSGKTFVPFCTSHSSGIGSSDTNLHALAPKANWMEGKRFAAGASKSEISEWIDSLGLKTGG